MQQPPLRYRTLIAVLSPVLILVVLWQAWQVRSRRFALQRLGLSYPQSSASSLWIHCASVGEVQAALPLINHLRLDTRFSPLVVSTATPTGADTVLRQDWHDVEHVFLPVDLQSAVRRAFERIQPRALVLMETEIWPNLIHAAKQRHVSVTVVNARLSARTLNAPHWLMPVYHQAFNALDAVLAKSAEDAANFVLMGAAADRTTTIGNLKFAAIAQAGEYLENPITRAFWLAASTHEDEELQLCTALQSNASAHEHLLVIAPRHPKRSEKIQQQLHTLGIKLAVRSKGEPVDEHTQVYLADTLGEMSLWLQHARAVFMGGSLVPIGGHNLLEPAAAGLAIVSGSHLHNFREEADLLLPSGALQQAESAAEVITYITQLMADTEHAVKLGEQGRQAVLSQANVLERYVEALLPLVAKQ